jgi:hypothetical protein
MSFSLALVLPSIPGRASAAIGSAGRLERLPSGSSSKRSDAVKHSCCSWPGVEAAFGSPSTIRVKMRSLRPMRLKERTSSSTHRERAAAGEQMTMRLRES